MIQFKRALVSVSDKTGVLEFLKPLVEQGLEVVSTGGTAQYLKSNGISVIEVSHQTGFPEVMGGRVKTLHPHIHMCLLSRDNNKEDQETLQKFDLSPFDLVVGNLYPFEKAVQDRLEDDKLVEFIDIGGPSFLRAAAKNYSRITVICHPQDYAKILSLKEIDYSTRKELAAKVFYHTSSYDSMVADSLCSQLDMEEMSLGGEFISQLRYGENPQQQAAWFRGLGIHQTGLSQESVLQGKPLSYNNLLDLDAAVRTLQEFTTQPCCVAVKHLNPCGVGLGGDLLEATEKSLQADPVSVFGGIVALNEKVNEDVAIRLSKIFLECVVAPDYSNEALEVFSKKKNLRLLSWPTLMEKNHKKQFKTILGGFLVQTEDLVDQEWNLSWQVIGEEPSERVKSDLLMAWKVCAHLKSNAISLVSEGQTLGLGMGQVNRVDAVSQAIERQKQFHSSVQNVVLASDAFFPFADSIEKIFAAGIRWVIQPGGSIRDDEVLAKAKELGVNLVLTGKRHFYH